MIDQEKIHKKSLSEDSKERIEALEELESNFLVLPDKEKAWDDLCRLMEDEDRCVKWKAVETLGSLFSNVPDKKEAWKELHKLTFDQDGDVRLRAIEALKFSISEIPDKEQAFGDLCRLTRDKDRDVKWRAIYALGFHYSQVSDKKQAWKELHRSMSDKDMYVRGVTIYALRFAFSNTLDKKQAWSDLHCRTNDKDSNVRGIATSTLGSVYFYVPDKQQAWNDLIRLAHDEDSIVRFNAAYAIGFAFSHVLDKQQAWKDLHILTTDQKGSVRSRAAPAIGFAYPQVLDKQQAFDDLHNLTTDEISYVRSAAASAISSVFSQVPDKQQAWNDLTRLVHDKDSSVRSQSNHSLGKVSIFKASQSEREEEYKRELETAIVFFERAAHESHEKWSNPSQFCLPFYRSFHTIIFKRHEAKEEVDKYLSEAKDAVRGSKSKELLLEAVENLANALNEVQNLENIDLQAMKGELNFYRKYCDRAAELMIEIEETAPFATIAMRKGLPILDRNLKELLEEIQKKTEVIRKQTKGTPFEKLGYDLNEGSLSLLQVRDLVGFKKQVQNLENKLSSMCSKLPEGQKDEACELLKIIQEEHSIEDKIPLINDVLSKFSYQLDMIICLNRIDASLSSVNKKVDELIIISRPGISEEIVISTGFQLAGSGFQHSIVIPLQEISYSELQEDLKQIRGKTIDKLSKLPKRLANKVNGYLLLHDEDDILEKLT